MQKNAGVSTSLHQPHSVLTRTCHVLQSSAAVFFVCFGLYFVNTNAWRGTVPLLISQLDLNSCALLKNLKCNRIKPAPAEFLT